MSSETFISCPNGSEEVGPAVPFPGGIFMSWACGCESDWKVIVAKVIVTQVEQGKLNPLYTEEETGSLEELSGSYAPGSWHWRPSLSPQIACSWLLASGHSLNSKGLDIAHSMRYGNEGYYNPPFYR